MNTTENINAEIVIDDRIVNMSKSDLMELIKHSTGELMEQINNTLVEYNNDIIDKLEASLDSVKGQFEGQFQRDKIYWNSETKRLLKLYKVDDIVTADMIRDNVLLSYGVKNYQGFTPKLFETIRLHNGWTGITNNQVMIRIITETIISIKYALNKD